MEFRILNKAFRDVHLLETFSSYIWTDRYNTCGDFEIIVAPNKENLELLQEGFYVWTLESEHSMIIEDIRISTDVEMGNEMIVTGRSLESMLSGRISWRTIILEGGVQDGIRLLVVESIISPSDNARRIPNFIFELSDDPAITSMVFENPVEVPMGADIYEKIRHICYERDLGFKIVLSDDNRFIFSLYYGIDRSYNQTFNPYVIFSPEFDNLFNSNFFSSIRDLRTVALVAGENPRSEGQERVVVETPLFSGAGAGLTRRELFVDASGISSNDVTPAQYLELLRQRGLEALAEHIRIATFEGGIDISNMYVFGVDFFIGDIVQVANEYGIERPSRIVELVRSLTAEGYETIPTFITID